jgi:hypothetical protein
MLTCESGSSAAKSDAITATTKTLVGRVKLPALLTAVPFVDQGDLDGRSRRGHAAALKEDSLGAREAEMKPKMQDELAAEYVETSDPPFPWSLPRSLPPAEFCGA